jgi:hypothetical protein
MTVPSKMFTPIPGWPYYEITEDGDVLDGVTGEFRPVYLAGPGYLMVRLHYYDEDGESLGADLAYLHRLLAKTFLSNPLNYSDVDHIDRNPLNNSLSNLRWCPHRVNCENKGLYKNNKLKEPNIHFDATYNVFVARVKRDGVRRSHHFKTLEEAVEWRRATYGF